MPRLSGLQRDVLALYRRCFRAVRTKPTDAQPDFREYIRKEFRKHLDLPKKDFLTIEHLMRAGEKKLDLLGQEGVKRIHGGF